MISVEVFYKLQSAIKCQLLWGLFLLKLVRQAYTPQTHFPGSQDDFCACGIWDWGEGSSDWMPCFLGWLATLPTTSQYRSGFPGLFL